MWIETRCAPGPGLLYTLATQPGRARGPGGGYSLPARARGPSEAFGEPDGVERTSASCSDRQAVDDSGLTACPFPPTRSERPGNRQPWVECDTLPPVVSSSGTWGRPQASEKGSLSPRKAWE